MNTKHWLIATVAAATLGAGSAFADTTTTTTTTTPNYNEPGDHSDYWANYWDNSDIDTFYRPYEISVDVFGMGSLGESDINHTTGEKIVHDGRTGAGGGVNVFFCKWVGVGGDVWTEGWDRQLASGNLIFRVPIPKTVLAPYVFGGGGYEWNDPSSEDQATGDVGGGLEIRFMKHLGMFVDARYVFADKTDDFGVGRIGLRLNF